MLLWPKLNIKRDFDLDIWQLAFSLQASIHWIAICHLILANYLTFFDFLLLTNGILVSGSGNSRDILWVWAEKSHCIKELRYRPATLELPIGMNSCIWITKICISGFCGLDLQLIFWPQSWLVNGDLGLYLTWTTVMWVLRFLLFLFLRRMGRRKCASS